MSSVHSFENSDNQQQQPPQPPPPPSTFQSHDIGLRIQKKLFGRMMSNKTMAKTLIDSDSTCLMDNLHRLCKLYCRQHDDKIVSSGPKEIADKIVKYLMKITIKVAILVMNHQLDNDEMYRMAKIQHSIRSILMTIVSFHQVDFSYERQYLQQQMQKCKTELKQLIQRHLSEKSQKRIDFVFDFLGHSEFLDSFFTATTNNSMDKQWLEMKATIVEDINRLLERKNW
ncbi:tumor necrosis factor alpha-induced protein 8-like protein sigmar [Dermatophagoides farinae]|uniref:tumor necrosis factor alpha-induced protein 8-like protein sigmar n=1 Tax=Dermatophagoides farinae TaxID=6954 RepID=UPI003F5FD880